MPFHFRIAPAIALFAFLLVPATARCEGESSLHADYDLLGAAKYAAAVPIPPAGLRWSFEGASWGLESGRLWWAAPTAEGDRTGLVFEGKGRFHLDVADPTELAQLRRFTRRPALTALDLPFTAAVLRFAPVAGATPFPEAPRPLAGATTVLDTERGRWKQWLVERGFDVDARIVAALGTPGDTYLRIDLKTEELGWLTYEYDGRRMEEIRVACYNTTYSWEEVWLSLDRPEERDALGRPASRPRSPVDLLHADISADLTHAGRDKGWMAGRFQTALRFRATDAAAEGTRVVLLHLNSFARVTAVREGGHELEFIRDAIGRRDRLLDDRIFDESLLVLLQQPWMPDQERTLEVDYELEMRNYAPGRSWYPDPEGDEAILGDPHTGKLRLTVRRRHEARAMGTRLEAEDSEGEGSQTRVWVVDRPTKMLSFVYAEEKFHQETVKPEGGPEVVSFGERVGISTASKFHNVAADVANSLRYFARLFASPLPQRPFFVTAIDGAHGQSFDGFLELSQGSFSLESPGATELFRAHEVAHQWWGHQVGAASYRDAWLGEAFAEYSAMMFVEATVAGGDKLFREILRAYSDELTGSLRSGFSKFARPGVSLVNRAYGDRIGPIGLGWRANTGEVRTAYSSQVYDKGALVLNMLRRLLADQTGDDDAFAAVLRDFLARHRGGLASTADFEAAVARKAPGDWSWFFDQWVEGTAIPTYRWTYEILPGTNDRGQVLAQIAVTQRDVPAGFRMLVPVETTFADGTRARTRILVDRAEQRVTLVFAQRPKSLTFNPEGEVLSRTRQD